MSTIPTIPEADLYEPTADECKFAMLPHILQVFGGFVAPLVVFLVKRDSRYVRFHSLQSLIWQVIALVAMIVGFVGFFVLMMASVVTTAQNSKEVPKAFFLFPLIWLGFLGQYALNIVLAVVFAIQCSKGKWTRYPLIGRLALRWSK